MNHKRDISFCIDNSYIICLDFGCTSPDLISIGTNHFIPKISLTYLKIQFNKEKTNILRYFTILLPWRNHWGNETSAPLKKIWICNYDSIMLQSSLQVLTFYFLLSCKIRHRHHFFLKGNFSIKTCKFFNGVLADKRFALIFLIKTFPR